MLFIVCNDQSEENTLEDSSGSRVYVILVISYTDAVIDTYTSIQFLAHFRIGEIHFCIPIS